MKRPALRLLLALPALALLAPAALPLGAAAPASAAPAAPSDAEPSAELATDLLTPLTLAAAPDGTLWFSQNFRGVLDKLVPGQAAQTVYRKPGRFELGGVSVGGGRTWFTLSGRQETVGRLMSLPSTGGKPTEVADLGAYESAHNPDGTKRYGVLGVSTSCAAGFSGAKTPTYAGKTQTHPYATLHRGSTTYVADAAANALLAVKDNGRVRTVAVLPSVITRVTPGYAKGHKLPSCTVGKRYRAEPVPTDVVAGPGRTLFVSTLGDGPAAEGAQSAGAVYAVDSRSGKTREVVGGLTTPTGLTRTSSGDLYVAELFGGQIVKIPAGTKQVVPFAQVPLPGDVLSTPAGLLATTNVLSGTSGKSGDPVNGSLVRFPG